jgi:hypothetical protein
MQLELASRWSILPDFAIVQARLQHIFCGVVGNSFPRSVWERSVLTLRVAKCKKTRISGAGTRSVAAVRSHAERGNEEQGVAAQKFSPS